MFDFRILRVSFEIFLIGGARFLAASDALANLAEIVPGVPIVRLQLDNSFPAEVGGLYFVVLFEPLGKGVEFRCREFPAAGQFASLPHEQTGLHRVIDPAIDFHALPLGHEWPGQFTDLLDAPAAVAQFGKQRGNGIEMMQPVGDGIISDIPVLHRREEDNWVYCRIGHQDNWSKRRTAVRPWMERTTVIP